MGHFASCRSPFDKPVLSKDEGLRANRWGTDAKQKPFVLSLSKYERTLAQLNWELV